MKFCAISVCKNNSKKGRTSTFPSFQANRPRKKGSAFFRRTDKEFTSIKNFHICSELFETKQVLKTLYETNSLVPTIFNKHTVRRSPIQRGKRSNERRKRNGSEDTKEVLPAQIFRVSTELPLKDHGHVLKDNKVCREEAFKEKDYELEIAESSRFICSIIN